MLLGLIAYLAKPIKWVKEKEAEAASGTMLIFIGPLLAKLAIASGHSTVSYTHLDVYKRKG